MIVEGSLAHLSSDQRLLLTGLGRGSNRLRLDVLLGSDGEVSRLELGFVAILLTNSTLDQGLSLGGVVAHVLLGNLGGLLGVLLDQGADLLGLVIDNLTSVLDLAVDKLLVGGVNERGEEDDGGGDESKTPVRNNLDQVVRDEGAEGNLAGRVSK